MVVTSFRRSERGAVYNEEAYAQGKMLDHSSWQHGPFPLPRGITPSDVDMVFDNAGTALLCELSSSKHSWRELDIGQRRLYEGLIRGTRHLAILCSHNVPKTRKVNTRLDIETFQALIFEAGRINTSDLYAGNDEWQDFILRFYRDAVDARRGLLHNANSTFPNEAQRRSLFNSLPSDLSETERHRVVDQFLAKRVST